MNEIKPATDEKRIMSSDDEDSDFRDIQFPQDSVLEKVIIWDKPIFMIKSFLLDVLKLPNARNERKFY